MKNLTLTFSLLFIGFSMISLAQNNGKYTSLEKAFENPQDVIELQLSGITEKLPEDIAHFTNLETVLLTNLSESYDLNDAFEKLGKYTAVKNLYLHGNKHTTLPTSLASIKTLEFIELNENLSNDLPQIIEHLSVLEHFRSLSLRSMELTKLPSIITQLKLKSLNLDNNPNLNLDKTFDLLSVLQLEHLNISSAKFTVVPRSIGKLTHLKRLDMELIDGDFNNAESYANLSLLTTLEELNIQGNFFQKIHPSIQQLNYLKLLEIDGNCVEGKDFNELKKLLPNTEIHNEIPC